MSQAQTKIPGDASSGKGSARFTKKDHIRRRRDFLAAQARGRRMHTAHFGICVAAGQGTSPRLGLVVTKRLGKAVRRNRVKRLLREFFRRHKGLLPVADIVIMAKKGAAELSFDEVHAELARVLLPKSPVENHD